MNPQEINKRIAKFHLGIFPWEGGDTGGWTNEDGDECDPPMNYHGDLNAMHEAEKVLTKEQEDEYTVTLCIEVQPEPRLFHATAAQRAEAFLRTIGKWEDEE